MTAEVAIMNKSAVALAADSKVTVSTIGGEKTYDTMNKIFTLSKVCPVGIMIYGNADFMEHPWETIVKLYRSQKKSNSEPTVVKWGEDFWRFVTKFGPIREKQKQNNIRGIIAAHFGEIEHQAMMRAHMANVLYGSDKYKAIVERLMRVHISTAQRHDGWASAAQSKSIINKYGRILLEFATTHFKKKSKEFDTALEFGATMLLQEVFSSNRSGIVISGFGKNEIFPSLAHYTTDGYVGSRIKTKVAEPNNINLDNQSSIQAFAQGEIVARFMEGIDPGYSNTLQGMFKSALIETNLKTFEKWAPRAKNTDATRKKIAEAASKQYDALQRKTVQFRNQTFTKQILDMAAMLPKDELASLADSLVSLTSVHRRVSREIETVGGAVDVAIISKSDGFVWIKRKHYFPKELNPQFDINYMRETLGGRR